MRRFGWWIFSGMMVFLSGCATLATQLTLDNSLSLLQTLMEATSGQQQQFAAPDQQQQLVTLKSEVDSVIRTISEAANFPPENRKQVYLSALPLLNSSLEKSFNLSKTVASELGSQGTLNNLLNDSGSKAKQSVGNNLVEMYKNLAIVKRDLLRELEQPQAVDKLSMEYNGNVRLLKELCALKSGGSYTATSASKCLSLPENAALPETVPAAKSGI